MEERRWEGSKDEEKGECVREKKHKNVVLKYKQYGVKHK